MMIIYLIEKEVKQFFRNSFMPRLALMMPLGMMLILPWAANQEIRNINLSVIDNDHSSYSRQLIQKTKASNYFQFTDYSPTYSQAMEAVEDGKADVILEIPVGFERDLDKEGVACVLISANAVNGTKGAFGSNYLSSITNAFAEELREEAGIGITTSDNSEPIIEVVHQNKFNIRMDYKVFMVPALVVMLLTLICGFLPAFNIVSEKEKGTMEQMNVTPVTKLTFIIAKLIPYWVLGFLILTLCFGLAWLVYGLVPVGRLSTIYIAALIYILSVSGFGLVISNYSNTMQQAMFVIFFFLLVFILLSGLFTPVRSMPDWAQAITVINPLKYFMLVMRQVYLKGSGLTDLLPTLGALSAFALFSNTWAVLSYKKVDGKRSRKLPVDGKGNLKTLSPSKMKTLKMFHLLFAAIWFCGALCLNMFAFVKPMHEYGFALSTLINNWFIHPGMLGSFASGMVYSAGTKWGFTKHKWITAKWGATMFLIVLGIISLSMFDIIIPIRIYAVIQIVCLLFMLVISVFKPWKRTEKQFKFLKQII